MQSSSQVVTTNKQTPNILCPSCRPTNSVRALKGESIALHGPALLKLTLGSCILVLTTKGSWLLWGEWLSLSSGLSFELNETKQCNFSLSDDIFWQALASKH